MTAFRNWCAEVRAFVPRTGSAIRARGFPPTALFPVGRAPQCLNGQGASIMRPIWYQIKTIRNVNAHIDENRLEVTRRAKCLDPLMTSSLKYCYYLYI